MRKYLPCLMSCILMVALYGCSSEKNCSVAVGAGNTGTYQDSDGVQHQLLMTTET